MSHMPTIEAYSLETLKPLGRDALMEVFKQLSAPHGMDGEYGSALPDFSATEWRSAMEQVGKDYWLGKSYAPEALDGHQGHGLNRYRRLDGSISRNSRFVWDIGPSIVDGNPSLVMRYAHFQNWGGGHDLIDEVRVAGPGCYLGLYHTAAPVPGFTPRPGRGRSGIEFFFLTGPDNAFVAAEQD